MRVNSGLSSAFPGTRARFDRASASALRGRQIILDQDLNLRSAMGAWTEGQRTPVLFFGPSVEDEGAEATSAARLPKPLETRIVYTHSAIPWTITERIRRRRPGRVFLQSNGLVPKYRTDRLLELLHDVVSARPSVRVQVASLQYGCALHPTSTRRSGRHSRRFPSPSRLLVGNGCPRSRWHCRAPRARSAVTGDPRAPQSLAPRGAGRCTLLGRGLRYRCAFARRATGRGTVRKPLVLRCFAGLRNAEASGQP
jgi:hypothetical protein